MCSLRRSRRLASHERHDAKVTGQGSVGDTARRRPWRRQRSWEGGWLPSAQRCPPRFMGEADRSAHYLLLVGLGPYPISVAAGLDLSGGATPHDIIGQAKCAPRPNFRPARAIAFDGSPFWLGYL